jgi:predicted transglutaminase-like cysteine proteinase
MKIVRLKQLEILRNSVITLTKSDSSLRNPYKISTAIFLVLTIVFGINSLYVNHQIKELKENYDNKLTDVQKLLNIEQALHISNGLATFYEHLRSLYGPTGANGVNSEIDFWKASANFSALLSLHSLGRIFWPRLEAEYYFTFGETSYQTAAAKLQEILRLMEIPADSTPVQKINIILQFINQFITYQYDYKDYFHAPLETLGYKSGDCDDFAILAATFFELVGIESAVALVQNSKLQGHSLVLVQLNELEGYPFVSFSNLVDFNLDPGRWILIEPQSNLDHYNSSQLMNWSLISVGKVDVNNYTEMEMIQIV